LNKIIILWWAIIAFNNVSMGEFILFAGELVITLCALIKDVITTVFNLVRNLNMHEVLELKY